MKKLIWLKILISMISFSHKTEAQTTTSQADTIKAALSRAQDLAKQGNVEEASKIYLKIMETHPDNRAAAQGWILTNMKRTPKSEEDAIKSLEELSRSYPNNPWIIFFKAYIEAEYNHTEEALKDVDKLICIQPDTASNYILKGQMLYAMKKYQESFDAYERATSLDPKRTDVWGMKALALLKMGRLDEALPVINKQLKLSPNSSLSIYNRACIYSLKGDKTRALADLKKAITLNPSFKQSAIQDEDFKSLYDDEEFKKLTLVLAVGQKAPDSLLEIK